MEGILIVTAVVSLATGIAISYWLVQKRLAKQMLEQDKQARQAIEQAERNHESRMQQTIGSLRSDYESQLQESRQMIAQLEGTNATSRSLQSQYERELEACRQQMASLEKKEAASKSMLAEYEGELESIRQQISSLEERDTTSKSMLAEYEGELESSRQQISSLEERDATSKSMLAEYERELEACRQQIASLERRQEEWSQEITKYLGQQYEIMWKQAQLAELAQSDEEKETRSPVEEVTPTSPATEDLSQNVTAWGESGKTKSIGQLTRYTNHQNADVRRLVASGLGKIAASNSMRTEIERLIPTLGKLSQDPKPEVRQAAVEALGMIKSDKVLPFLQRALKDAVGNVRKSANASIAKLNLGYGFKPKEPIKPIEVKKPKR
ncbi:MAG: HEAT repeat domain-containing protein [Hormoscilla sp.]